MKRITMLVSLIVALVLSQTAAADNRNHRRGYDNFGFNNYSRSHSRYDYRSDYRNYNRYSRSYYSRSYNPYHYNSRRGSSIHISYGNRYSRRHDHDAGYFVGGLVLGSLLSAPRYSPPVERVIYRSAPVVTQREVVIVTNPVNSTAPTSSPVASGRRLLRDLEGNCFERIIDAEGNEIRVQLEAAECRF